MMRILGLDVGQRRIGVAVSDELGWMAQPLTVIGRDDDETALQEVARLAQQHGAAFIVVGLPRRTDGEEGPEAAAVRAFGDAIEQRLRVPVHYQDERFSTAEAERGLIASGMRRTRRRQVIDKVAAGIILQSYLDRHHRKNDNEEWSP